MQLDEKRQEWFERYLFDVNNRWQGYHDHKEKMHITATIIFVGGSFAGASYLRTQDINEPFWLALFLVGYICLCYTYYNFRENQIIFKQYAARMVSAFSQMIIKSLNQSLDPKDMCFVKVSHFWPDGKPDKSSGKFAPLDNFWIVPRWVAEFALNYDKAPPTNPEKYSFIAPLVGGAGFFSAWAWQLFYTPCTL